MSMCIMHGLSQFRGRTPCRRKSMKCTPLGLPTLMAYSRRTPCQRRSPLLTNVRQPWLRMVKL